jgi:hypothetical protein
MPVKAGTASKCATISVRGRETPQKEEQDEQNRRNTQDRRMGWQLKRDHPALDALWMPFHKGQEVSDRVLHDPIV